MLVILPILFFYWPIWKILRLVYKYIEIRPVFIWIYRELSLILLEIKLKRLRFAFGVLRRGITKRGSNASWMPCNTTETKG